MENSAVTKIMDQYIRRIYLWVLLENGCLLIDHSSNMVRLQDDLWVDLCYRAGFKDYKKSRKVIPKGPEVRKKIKRSEKNG